MLLFDWRGEHNNSTCSAWHQRKPSVRRIHAGQLPKHPAKPPNFDSQSRPMRFIGKPRPKGPRKKRPPRYVSWPRLAQRACEREQHWTTRERDHPTCTPNDVTTRIHDERLRG